MRRVFLSALAGFCLSSGTLANEQAGPESAVNINIVYSGSLLVFRLADIQLSGVIGPETYGMNARFTAAGLAALFSDSDIEAGITGYSSEIIQPWRYEHRNHESNTGRVVGIDFPDGVAMPDINPPFGSTGEPPASEEERNGAVDPVSALLRMSLGQGSQGGELCSGVIPVFDGKARYDLRLERAGENDIRTRAWRGEAIRCNAYYVPISGYDADEFPSDEEVADPIVFWLAPFNDGALHLPVRIRTNTGFGSVTIEARHLTVE